MHTLILPNELIFIYRVSLGEAYYGDLSFADSLEAFGAGQDDPVSVAIGGCLAMLHSRCIALCWPMHCDSLVINFTMIILYVLPCYDLAIWLSYVFNVVLINKWKKSYDQQLASVLVGFLVVARPLNLWNSLKIKYKSKINIKLQQQEAGFSVTWHTYR